MSEHRCRYPGCPKLLPQCRLEAVCPEHPPRTCAESDCEKRLSRYNPTAYCTTHEGPAEIARQAQFQVNGRRRVREPV
jgi:hypothetical protein